MKSIQVQTQSSPTTSPATGDAPSPRTYILSTLRYLLLAIFRPFKAAHLAERISKPKLILSISLFTTTYFALFFYIILNINKQTPRSLLGFLIIAFTPILVINLFIIVVPYLITPLFASRLTPPHTPIKHALNPTLKRIYAIIPHTLIILTLALFFQASFIQPAVYQYNQDQNQNNPTQYFKDSNSQEAQAHYAQWKKNDTLAWQNASTLVRYNKIYNSLLIALNFLYPTTIIIIALRKPIRGQSSPYPYTCPKCNYPLFYHQTKFQACPECGSPSHLPSSSKIKYLDTSPLNPLTLLQLLYLPILSPKSFARRIQTNNTTPQHHNFFILAPILIFFIILKDSLPNIFTLRLFWFRYIVEALFNTYILLSILIFLPIIYSLYHRIRHKNHTTNHSCHATFIAVKTLNLLIPLALLLLIITPITQHLLMNQSIYFPLAKIFSPIMINSLVFLITYHRTLTPNLKKLQRT
ncbi:hypothetical protein JD969_09820 [Planctomycetota bacterium]|nr:hypothetical protein JD969_09820 [Planctomycetota bacterium]